MARGPFDLGSPIRVSRGWLKELYPVPHISRKCPEWGPLGYPSCAGPGPMVSPLDPFDLEGLG